MQNDFEKLKSTTLGEVCNFLDTEWGVNNSFEKFSKFCIEYFSEDKCNKEKNIETNYGVTLLSSIMLKIFSLNQQEIIFNLMILTLLKSI